MEEISYVTNLRARLGQLLSWRWFWLCLLLIVTLVLHFSTIMQPNELVFDETYYVSEARSIIAGEGMLYPQHPPLGKLLIVLGIRLFGDNPLGWRFFSVLCGTMCIVLFYLICNRLNMPREATLLATSLLAFENLNFIQASLAMLDVYSVTFLLCAFLLYLRGNYLSSGICIAISGLAKLPGLLALLVIFLHCQFTGRKQWKPLLISSLSAVGFFLLLMPVLDYAISGKLFSPVSRIVFMLSSSLTLAGGYHEGASRPWDWLISPTILFYWFDPQYILTISLTLWVLIIPVTLYMVFRAIRGSNAGLFGLSWFASTYLPWIPLSIITARVTYVYYFYPTIGAICIGLGLGLSQLLDFFKSKRQSKVRWLAVLAVSGYFILHLAIFIILSPTFVPLVKWFPIPP